MVKIRKITLSTVADQKALRYYFDSATSPSVIWVDIKNVGLKEGDSVKKLDLTNYPMEYHGDVSDKFIDAKPFSWLNDKNNGASMSKIILLALVLLSTSLNAASFNFGYPSFPVGISTYSYTSNGIAATVTTNPNSTFYINSGWVEIAQPDSSISGVTTDNTFVTVSFDKAINISSLTSQIFASSDGDKYYYTPIGGNNNAIEVTYNSTTTVNNTTWGTGVLTPNWSGITGFTVTSNGTALPNSRIWGFDNSVFTLVNTKTYLDSAVLASAESNTKKSAQTLQNIKDNGSYTGMSSVFTALDGLSTDSLKAQKIEETTPQTATSSVSASNNIAQGISNIVTQRQNINLGGGLNSGDEMFVDKNIWIKPFGSIGSQNDKDGINGFDINTYGLAFGVDGEYDDNAKFGLGFFYTNANVDVNNVQQSSDLDVYSLVVYGSNPIIDDKTKFMYQLGYSLQKNNSNRYVSLTSATASADYISQTATLDLKVLRDYKITDDLLVQPMVSSTYRYFKNPSYSETGAGALNLDVEKFSTTELLVGLGTMAHYKLNDTSKIIGNLNVNYDLHDRTTTVTSSYQGASGVTFNTDGIDNGRVSYDVGVGYENQIDDLSNINISYNYQGKGSDYSNNVISAKYIYKF
jgi:outer membrane autotransporter protein